MAHRKHKEVIEAWLNGAQVQHKDCAGQWEDSEQDQPGFFGHMEYRIKPVEPERVYPVTQMTDQEIKRAWSDIRDDPMLDYEEERRELMNVALRHACDAGQIVTREEFDRAVEAGNDRAVRVAKAVYLAMRESETIRLSEIIESVK